MSAPAVQFAGVCASRGGRRVLHDISLSIAGNETMALVGRSGSGKTTVLRLVNRLLEPDSGEILVEGRSTTAWDPTDLRRRTGYVIQDAGLFPHLTVAENVATVPHLLGWAEPRITGRVDELLTLVGLEPGVYRARWPDELSGGERQRVGLARALAGDPPVLLMDEPFGALDPITKGELHREFKRIQRSLNRAVVLVTHDMREAFELADRVAILHEGRVIACEAGDRLLELEDSRVRSLLAGIRVTR